MKIGIVSDEIVLDFAEAVRYGTSWGIMDYEIRCLTSGRVPYLSEEEIQTVLQMKKEKGVNIAALSPGIFKISLQDEKIKTEKDKVLFDTFRLAERLGTNLVIIFGVNHYENEPAENYERVVSLFTEVARKAQWNGFMLAVENEPGHWCDTGANTAKILHEVNSPCLKANWDLGNSFCSGEIPYPDGYQAIKDFVINLHVKDYRKKDGNYECVVIGDGEIDYPGQFRALLRDNSLHHITLETHCLPFLEKSEESVRRLKKILAEL